MPELVLGGVEVLVDATLVGDVREQQDREHGDGERAEDHVGDEQPDRRDHDHQRRARGERDRGEHRDGGVGVDPGAADEVAVGAPLVPRDRLADEPVDDLPAERRADAELRHRRRTRDASTTPADRTTPTTNTNAMPAATVDDSTVALVEPGHEDVVDHPPQGDAREHGADREDGGARRRESANTRG